MAPKVQKLNLIYLLKEIKQNTKLAKEVIKRYNLPNEYKSSSYTHQNLLEAAIGNNNLEIVKLLIEKGCNVNMKILHEAIDQQNLKIINVILQTEESLLQGKVYEMSPLHYAAKKKVESVFKFLLKKGADWQAVDSMGDTVLHAAAGSVDENETYDSKQAINIMKIVLSKKIAVDTENYDGETALHFAAKSQQKEVVEFLLSQYANINAVDKKGNSALHMIIKHNCHSKFDYHGYNYDYDNNLDEMQKDKSKAEFIDWLIPKGLNAELENNDGKSPLYLAVIYRQKEVIKVLLRYCFKISHSDNNNAVFDIFLKAYLKVNEAASDEIVEIIREFLQKGAAVDRINKYGDSPIDLVNRFQQTRIKEILLENRNKMDDSVDNKSEPQKHSLSEDDEAVSTSNKKRKIN